MRLASLQKGNTRDCKCLATVSSFIDTACTVAFSFSADLNIYTQAVIYLEMEIENKLIK